MGFGFIVFELSGKSFYLKPYPFECFDKALKRSLSICVKNLPSCSNDFVNRLNAFKNRFNALGNPFDFFLNRSNDLGNHLNAFENCLLSVYYLFFKTV